MPTIAVIQARYSSTRLPGKVLASIVGHPLLWHVVNRVRQATTLDGFVVATGDLPANDGIEALCVAEGWPVYRGSEDDVLGRFYGAASGFEPEVVVRITGDCPLHSPDEIDRVVRHRERWRLEYVSNCHPPRLPDGIDVESFTFRVLEWAHEQATIPSDREHVTPYLRRNLPGYQWSSLNYVPDLSRWRLTVDEPADLQLVRVIMGALGMDCTWQQAVDFLLRNPDVASLNEAFKRNAKYQEEQRV